MKTIKNGILIILILIIKQNIRAQGFVNLDFEFANISAYSPGDQNVPVSAALPGWTALFISGTSTNVATQVWYDGISLGGAAISVNDSSTYPGFVPIQGNYSAYLFGGPGLGTAMISQTGLVPSGTKSLLIDIQQSASPFNAPFMVMVNGQNINMVPLQTFSTYTLYGGDVSSFAGLVSTLSFAEPPPANFPPSAILVDDFTFSPSSVPEPSTLALGALGASLLGFRRWRNSSR